MTTVPVVTAAPIPSALITPCRCSCKSYTQFGVAVTPRKCKYSTFSCCYNSKMSVLITLKSGAVITPYMSAIFGTMVLPHFWVLQ